MGSWKTLTSRPILETTESAKRMIKEFEGFSPKQYICSGGKLTIGFGHTKYASRYNTITVEEAEELFKDDIADAERVVRRLVSHPLNVNQFSALVSFVFNLGALKFEKSTLLKRLNAGDVFGAAQEFSKWVYSKNKKRNGLVIRRAKERELFQRQPVIRNDENE